MYRRPDWATADTATVLTDVVRQMATHVLELLTPPTQYTVTIYNHYGPSTPSCYFVACYFVPQCDFAASACVDGLLGRRIAHAQQSIHLTPATLTQVSHSRSTPSQSCLILFIVLWLFNTSLLNSLFGYCSCILVIIMW